MTNVASYNKRTVFNIERPEQNIDDPGVKLAGNTIKSQHPVENGQFTLVTDQIQDLHDYMLDSIRMGFEGTIIYGSAYAGKTYAMREIERWFKDENDQDFATVRVILPEKKFTFKELYQYLLDQITHEPLSKTAAALKVRNRLISVLVDLGQHHGNRIVLILDEAENLRIEHYKNLKHIYNCLEEFGVVMYTFLVGTEALLDSRNVFKTSGAEGAQIIRRFMTNEHRFTGITDYDSLAYALGGYDMLTYEGETFTEHYFPEAWKKGARMVDIADDMMQAMHEITSLPKIPEIPMGYFTKVINATLKFYGADSDMDDGNGGTLKKEWPSKEDIKKIMIYQNLDYKLVDLSSINKGFRTV